MLEENLGDYCGNTNTNSNSNSKKSFKSQWGKLLEYVEVTIEWVNMIFLFVVFYVIVLM